MWNTHVCSSSYGSIIKQQPLRSIMTDMLRALGIHNFDFMIWERCMEYVRTFILSDVERRAYEVTSALLGGAKTIR